jgi:hypothetical protein
MPYPGLPAADALRNFTWQEGRSLIASDRRAGKAAASMGAPTVTTRVKA